MGDILLTLLGYAVIFALAWLTDRIMKKKNAARKAEMAAIQAEQPSEEQSPAIIALKERWSKIEVESH